MSSPLESFHFIGDHESSLRTRTDRAWLCTQNGLPLGAGCLQEFVAFEFLSSSHPSSSCWIRKALSRDLPCPEAQQGPLCHQLSSTTGGSVVNPSVMWTSAPDDELDLVGASQSHTACDVGSAHTASFLGQLLAQTWSSVRTRVSWELIWVWLLLLWQPWPWAEEFCLYCFLAVLIINRALDPLEKQ